MVKKVKKRKQRAFAKGTIAVFLYEEVQTLDTLVEVFLMIIV